MSDVRIRKALRRDVPEIQAIYNHSVLHDTGSYDYEPRPIGERYAWFEDHERSGLPIYVAEAGGDVVGWSSLSRFRPRPGYRYTVEDSIYVRDDHRRAGIGRVLLERVVHDAGAVLGMKTVVAVIGDAENHASIGLHARCGFVQAALLKQVGFKFGRWLDQVWMQRML